MKKLISKELIIGICAIAACLILFFGIDYLKGINLLNPSHYYYVNCSNVQGLDLSAPVTINGYKVGKVREITYNYEHPGKVKVLLAVDDKLQIPAGSYAEMSQTLLSGAFITIHLGDGTEMLERGSEIPIKESKDLIDAIASDVMPTVNQILPRIDSLIYNLNLVVSDPAIRTSIQRLDGITGDILSVTNGLKATVGRDIPVVMKNAKSLTTNLDSVSLNLMALATTLKELPLASTMDNVNQLTDNLNKFSVQLNNPNSTLGLLTKDPELYNRINRVAADVDSLIVDIKKNPKRYISIKLL